MRREDPYQLDAVASARDVAEWVLPAVQTVLDAQARLPPLTWSLAHHDPAPAAFHHDARTEGVALIDLTGAGEGPVLFGVASAVMYLGGHRKASVFLSAYLESAAPRLRDEIARHLAALLRFRGAVQAAYFSNRIAAADLTGIDSQEENWKGLIDARDLLAGDGQTDG